MIFLFTSDARHVLPRRAVPRELGSRNLDCGNRGHYKVGAMILVQ